MFVCFFVFSLVHSKNTQSLYTQAGNWIPLLTSSVWTHFFSKLSMYVIHRNQEERTDTTKMRLIYLLSESLVEGSWLLFLVFYPKHSVIIPDRSNKLSRKAGTCIHKSKELDRNSQSTRLKVKVYHTHDYSRLFLEGNYLNRMVMKSNCKSHLRQKLIVKLFPIAFAFYNLPVLYGKSSFKDEVPYHVWKAVQM